MGDIYARTRRQNGLQRRQVFFIVRRQLDRSAGQQAGNPVLQRGARDIGGGGQGGSPVGWGGLQRRPRYVARVASPARRSLSFVVVAASLGKAGPALARARQVVTARPHRTAIYPGDIMKSGSSASSRFAGAVSSEQRCTTGQYRPADAPLSSVVTVAPIPAGGYAISGGYRSTVPAKDDNRRCRRGAGMTRC